MFTRSQLARELHISYSAVLDRLSRKTITPTTTDADGKELFAESYVRKLVSEQRSRLDKD